MTTETRKDNGGDQQAKYEFEYDLAGNRLSQSRYTASATWEKYHTYEYNDANQLTLERRYDYYGGTQDKETQYVYNDLGDLTDKNIELSDFGFPDYNDEYWDYAYDAYSRLIDVDKNSNNVADYTFNMLGNRVKKVTNTDTIKMLYDGYDCVADYDNSGTPALLRYYITPGLDENLLVYDEETTDEEYFYLHDGLGTVRQIINDTQTIENQYDYEGFGTSISHSENIYNRYRYTGREYDKETESDPDFNGGVGTKDGLYYYRARTYDSTIGSFTSRDPIPALNLYSYCSSNPIIFIDPLGQTFYFGSAFGALAKHSASGDIKEVLAKKTDEETEYDLTDEKTDEEDFEPDPTFYKGKTTGYGLTGDKAKWGAGAEIEDALDELKKVGKGDIWWFQGHSSEYDGDWHIEGDWSLYDWRSDYRTRLADEDDLNEAYGGKGGIIILESCYGNRIGAAKAFEGADVLIYFDGECVIQKSEEVTTYFFGALLAGKTIDEAAKATKLLQRQMRHNQTCHAQIDEITTCCVLNIKINEKKYTITDEYGNTRLCLKNTFGGKEQKLPG